MSPAASEVSFRRIYISSDDVRLDFICSEHVFQRQTA